VGKSREFSSIAQAASQGHSTVETEECRLLSEFWSIHERVDFTLVAVGNGKSLISASVGTRMNKSDAASLSLSQRQAKQKLRRRPVSRSGSVAWATPTRDGDAGVRSDV
jgi:hypothetical protein